MKFCTVLFLSKLRAVSSEGPVYTLSSGKFVTIALVNKILKQTSQLAGLPDGTAYFAHSQGSHAHRHRPEPIYFQQG